MHKIGGRTLLLCAALLIAGGLAIHGSGARSARLRALRELTLELPPGPPLDARAVRFVPAGHVLSARLDVDGTLRVRSDGVALTVHIPELCPVRVPATERAAQVRLRAVPLIDLGEDRAQVGYDEAIELRVEAGCAEARQGRIAWGQLEGKTLSALQTADHGYRLDVRTLPLAAYLPEPLPRGIVALSPRTQGRYVLEATAHLADGAVVRRAITITSAARATGMSSLAVGQRVLLAPAGYRVERAPRLASAEVEHRHGVETFAPDVAGKFTLLDAAGGRLEVQALTHDRTPLDCGRAECHASISDAARDTPMSHTLESAAVAAAAFSGRGCALDCHAVGERGLRDGGFLDLARSLSFRPLANTTFESLPHALQRLAGVRCTSCHGPGAIPSLNDRSRILRASVCATCHDAPPRYTHVEAWSRSRMARSDASADARHLPACAKCHTTGGFLDGLGVRVRPDRSRDLDDALVGIACSACHAAHGATLAGRGLVRQVAAPASLGEAGLPTSSSTLCASCHAPADDEVVPSASSAALWRGSVVLPLRLGRLALTGPAPHAEVPGGCVGCHGGRGGEKTAGQLDHSFRVDAASCSSCHAQATDAEQGNAELQGSARALLLRIRQSCGATNEPSASPLHTQPTASGCVDSDRRAQAFFATALVLEDRAAYVHNAPFARSLVAQAEALLQSGGGPVRSRRPSQ